MKIHLRLCLRLEWRVGECREWWLTVCPVGLLLIFQEFACLGESGAVAVGDTSSVNCVDTFRLKGKAS